MPKFSEETLNGWRKPPSDSEEQKLTNANRMVRDAINADPELSKLNIEVFGQGSYANDTNVKQESDIDINVCFGGEFYYDLPQGKTPAEFGFTDSDTYNYQTYKTAVERALVNHFGRANVVRYDKCITIKENTNRVEADVVPTFQYRRYSADKSYVEGVKFRTDPGSWIINFPKQHIENGKQKNASTQRRFKRLTRLFRRLRYRMIDDGVSVNKNITSFLLECMVFNVPNNIFNDNDTWTEMLKQSITHLYNATKTEEGCKEWGEVSELLYLFRPSRKWSREEAHTFLLQMWRYMEFKS